MQKEKKHKRMVKTKQNKRLKEATNNLEEHREKKKQI